MEYAINQVNIPTCEGKLILPYTYYTGGRDFNASTFLFLNYSFMKQDKKFFKVSNYFVILDSNISIINLKIKTK